MSQYRPNNTKAPGKHRHRPEFFDDDERKYDALLHGIRSERQNAGDIAEVQRLANLQREKDRFKREKPLDVFRQHIRNSYQQERETKEGRAREMRRCGMYSPAWSSAPHRHSVGSFSTPRGGSPLSAASVATASNAHTSAGHTEGPSRSGLRLNAEAKPFQPRKVRVENSDAGSQPCTSELSPAKQTITEGSDPKSGERQDSGYVSLTPSPTRPQTGKSYDMAEVSTRLFMWQRKEWAAAPEGRLPALQDIAPVPEQEFEATDESLTKRTLPAYSQRKHGERKERIVEALKKSKASPTHKVRLLTVQRPATKAANVRTSRAPRYIEIRLDLPQWQELHSLVRRLLNLLDTIDGYRSTGFSGPELCVMDGTLQADRLHQSIKEILGERVLSQDWKDGFRLQYMRALKSDQHVYTVHGFNERFDFKGFKSLPFGFIQGRGYCKKLFL